MQPQMSTASSPSYCLLLLQGGLLFPSPLGASCQYTDTRESLLAFDTRLSKFLLYFPCPNPELGQLPAALAGLVDRSQEKPGSRCGWVLTATGVSLLLGPTRSQLVGTHLYVLAATWISGTRLIRCLESDGAWSTFSAREQWKGRGTGV